jgi:hypothetical protein
VHRTIAAIANAASGEADESKSCLLLSRISVCRKGK